MLPRRRFDPSFPQAGETEWFATFQHHAERLPLPLAFLALIKTVSGNQAAPVLERLAKRIPSIATIQRLKFSKLVCSLCLLDPKHRRQSHSIKHVHTSIFVLPQTAFGRQFSSKFNRIFSGEQFCHFVLCSFDIAEQCVTQLVS